MKLLAIAGIFPSRLRPHRGTFVRQQFECLGKWVSELRIVAPVQLATREGLQWNDAPLAIPGEKIVAVGPKYLSCGNFRLCGLRVGVWLTLYFFRRSVLRLAWQDGWIPDVTYGHFLYPAGICAVDVASRRTGTKSVVALGESSLVSYQDTLGLHFVRCCLRSVKGIVCVSDKNRQICEELYQVPGAKILVARNGVDTARFKPIPRVEARRKLQLPLGKPIVAFVGHLIARKGLPVLQALVARLSDVGFVLVGEGEPLPTTANLLHIGPVAHADVPLWLNAADAFVFPSVAEGCPNALLEALACGLPAVASDIPEIRELTGSEGALLVEAGKVEAFERGIREILMRQEMTVRLGQTAVQVARHLSLEARMKRISEWMSQLT